MYEQARAFWIGADLLLFCSIIAMENPGRKPKATRKRKRRVRTTGRNPTRFPVRQQSLSIIDISSCSDEGVAETPSKVIPEPVCTLRPATDHLLALTKTQNEKPRAESKASNGKAVADNGDTAQMVGLDRFKLQIGNLTRSICRHSMRGYLHLGPGRILAMRIQRSKPSLRAIICARPLLNFPRSWMQSDLRTTLMTGLCRY